MVPAPRLTLEPRIELSFRVADLYKQVGYMFKPSHIIGRIKVPVSSEQKQEYVSRYNAVLKKHHYSIVTDLGRFVLFCIGRFTKII